MEEIEHGNKKASSPSFLIILIEGDGESGQTRLAFPGRKDGFLFRLAFLIEQIREKNHIENVPNPTPSFVELCIVSDPNLPGASLP
jgi:hypothetical protein